MKFSSEDIVWIKNVNRAKGESWAYHDVSCTESFLLNWSTLKGGSASTANIGDIIVLFQRPNNVNGKKNSKVHLTHFVTPISNEVIIDEKNPSHKYCRKVRLIAMANPINAIPNNGDFNFHKPNRGSTNPIINLVSKKELSEIEVKEQLWDLFHPHLCKGVKIDNYKPENPEGPYGESEGDKEVRMHIQQEMRIRNSKIVQKAKKNALKKGKGHIKCECCNFDFIETFGELGYGFIECHHKIFLSKGQRITNIDDLALVCSNCHRMLHRKNEKDEYYKVKELKELIIKMGLV